MTNEYHCRVCGYYCVDKPWGEDGCTPTYEICPCCGVEFGNEDYSIDSIKQYRTEWLNNGAIWFDVKSQPKHWDLQKQLSDIPIKYR